MTKNISAFPCVFENHTEHQMRTGTGMVVEPGHVYSSTGMTLRDYFAAKAMQGILANHYGGVSAHEGCAAKVAELAFQQAEAMLAARGGE